MFKERQTFVMERDRQPQKASIIAIEVVLEALKYCFEDLILVKNAFIAQHKRKAVTSNSKTQHAIPTLLFFWQWSP